MTTPEWRNQLYFGDNLPILRERIADESVDLIYLDPPFNSNADYNVLFREKSGQQSAAQITAFGDTWHWTLESESAYQDVVTNAPPMLSNLLQTMRAFLGENDMMAYLTMMAQRMVELRRVLKNTGSIYLHCDPTASHYLKLLMDSVFGPANFRSEIVWRRTSAHNNTSLKYGPIHDIILFYSKSGEFPFHPGTRPYTNSYVQGRFVHQDERGRYRTNHLTGPGRRSGQSGMPWQGFDPTAVGRHWAIPRSLREYLPDRGAGLGSQEQLDLLYAQGLIVLPRRAGGQPMYKQYFGPGVFYQDIWAYQPNTNGVLYNSDECIDQDVKYLENEEEWLDYPTQKPIGLLERIIRTSSDEGDLVLDPFCGCGTATAASERLNRRWIGIDITHLAITIVRNRLISIFKEDLKVYEIIGQPQDLESARALALESEHDGRYQFEWWALALVDARPARDRKKGADSGVDGYINFFDDNSGKAKRIVVQVKSGQVNRGQIAALKGDMEREKAEIGLFITMENPTRPMLAEAVAAGFYIPEHFPEAQYPRIQILTIEELLAGKQAEYPRLAPEATFRQAPRRRRSAGRQGRMV